MAFRTYDSFTNQFKSPYNFKAGRVNTDLSALMLQRLQEEKDRKQQELKSRTMLDRGLDLLMTGNYASAGFADGLVKMGQGKGNLGNAFAQAGNGVLAGLNVLGNGDTSSEYTYSRVMEDAGWKPESLGGKIAKGTVGFVGDILLDPTTYLTFGISALLKGTGRVGKALESVGKLSESLPGIAHQNTVDRLISKGIDPERASLYADKKMPDYMARFKDATHMTEDMAKQIVERQSHDRGFKLSPEQFNKDVSRFTETFNKQMGVDRGKEAYQKGISFGLGNLPFGDKFAPKLGAFGKSVEIVSDAKIREISDNLRISNVYSSVRDHIYGKKLGQLFSTNAPLYNLAKNNPTELYSFVKFLDTTTGQNMDKLGAEKAIRARAKDMNFSPSEATDILTLLQNKTVWSKAKDTLTFSETKKAETLQESIKQWMPKWSNELDTLKESKKATEEVLSQMDVHSADYKQEYEALKANYRDKIINLDLGLVKSKEEMHQVVEEMKNQIYDLQTRKGSNDLREGTLDAELNQSKESKDALNQQMIGLQQKEAHLNTRLKELQAKEVETVTKPDGSVAKEKEALRVELESVQSNLAKVNGEITGNPYYKPDLSHTVDVKQWDDLLKRSEEELKHHDAYQKLVTRYGDAVKKQDKVNGNPKEGSGKVVKDSQQGDPSADLQMIERFLNESSNLDLQGMRFQTPSKVHSFKLIDDLSTYIYGAKGKVMHSIKGKALTDLVEQIKKGYSPDDIQNFIAKNPRIYSEHAQEVYSFISKKLNYKARVKKGENALWEDVYTNKMTNKQGTGLQDKMHRQEELTPKEYQQYLDLENLRGQRELLFDQYFKRMSWDKFKEFRASVEHQEWTTHLEKEIDLNTEQRRSLFNDHDYASVDPATGKDMRYSDQMFKEDRKSLADIFTSQNREDMFHDAMFYFINAQNKQIYKKNKSKMKGNTIDEYERIGMKHYQDGQDMMNSIFDSGKMNYIHAITNNMEDVLKTNFPGKSYGDLNTGNKAYLMNLATAKTHGKDTSLTPEVISAMQQEVKKREGLAKIESVVNTTKPGMGITWHDGKRPREGTVTKVTSTENGTLYDAVIKGETHQVYARDVKLVRMLNKSTMSPSELLRISPVSKELLKQRDELTAQLDAVFKDILAIKGKKEGTITEQRVNPEVSQQIKTVSQQKSEVVNGKTELTQANESWQAKHEQIRSDYANTVEQGKQLDAEHHALTSRYEDMKKQMNERFAQMDEAHQTQRLSLIDFYKGKASELEHHMKNVEENRVLYEKALQDGLNSEEMKAFMPSADDARIKELETQLAENKDFLQWDIASQGKMQDSPYVNATTGRLTPEFFAHNTQLNEELKALTDHRDTIFKAINEHASINQKIMHLTDKIKAGEDAIKSFDATEIFAKLYVDPNFVEKVLDEANITESAKIGLDNMTESERVKEWVRIIKDEFDRMAKEEIGIDKLGMEQFMAMTGHYVPHILSGDGKRYIDSISELSEVKASLTNDLGYGTVFNEHALSRTIKGKTIEEINAFFANKLKGKNLFSDNIADIYLTRALRHNELMYDDLYMKTMMDTFGRTLEHGELPKEGFKAVVNYGQLKNAVRSLVKERVSQAKGQGMEVNKDLFDKHTAQVLSELNLPKNILDDFATPMIELNSKQLESLQPFGFVKEVNDAIVLKANQARKLVIKRDQKWYVKMYDKFLHWSKLMQTTVMPSFHMRNKMSNMYLGWLATGRDASNPRMQWNAIRATWSMGNREKLKDLDVITFRLKDGTDQTMTWDEAYDLAKAYKVIDEGYFANDAISHTASKGLLSRTPIPDKFDPTNTSEFGLFKAGSALGSRVENSDRLLQFVSHLKQGKTPQQAKELVDKYLFDYSDLTAFEQRVMKRIFPYYTWLRKNGRLQVSEFLEQPGKYRDTQKVENGVNGMSNQEDRVNDGNLADYARDWMQLPGFSTSKDANGVEKKLPILLNPNLPFQDISRLPNPIEGLNSLGGAVDEALGIMSQTAPMIKVPLELATNTNFFFNDQIKSKTDDPISPRLAHIANQLALYNAGEGLATKSDGDLGRHIVNSLTGVKTLAYDEERNRNMLLKQYYDRGGNQPGLVEKGLAGLGDIAGKALQGLGSGLLGGIESLTGQSPKKASDYNGALRPLSTESYNKLSAEDKKKYTLPTKKEAVAYNRKAQELEKKAYENEGVVKKFVWTFLDHFDKKPDSNIGYVTKVVDGDTFRVKVGDKESEVRMLLVDTPETVHPNKPIMPGGHEASNYSKKTLINKDVRLVFEGAEKDKYGRLLAYVELDGQDYGKDLVRKGLGKTRYTYDKFPDTTSTFSRTQDYYNAEAQASKEGKGIWQYKGYSTPGVDQEYNFDAVRRMIDQLNQGK